MPQHILQQPLWLQLWIGWLVVINFVGLIYWRRTEARWIVGTMLINVVLMNLLFFEFGYTRILGLSHVICWTPLLVYLWSRRSEIDPATHYGKYLGLLFATNLLSLLVDYVDVVRYLLGDGDLS